MKNIKNLFITCFVLAISAFSFAACSEDGMDEINYDYGHTKDCFARFILPDVLLRTSQNVVGGDFNTYLGSYVEHWAGTHNQLFKAEKRDAEVRVATTFNNNWGSVFENIRNCKLILEKTADDGTTTDAGDKCARGVGEIMLAYNLAIATDLFGDIPYAEVGDIFKYPYPSAQPQKEIYDEIFRLLDAAISDLSDCSNTITKYDLYYGGDPEAWTKFAYGLKARYTLRLIGRSANKDADYAKVIEYANASFASAAEQASMSYEDGNNMNPVFDFEYSRDGISACTSMHETLVKRNDPRLTRGAYVDPYSGDPVPTERVVLAPTGSPEESQYYYSYPYFIFGVLAPVHMLSYHEVLFLKAEAQVRLGQLEDAKETLKEAVGAGIANYEVNLAAPAGYQIDPFATEELTEDDVDAYFADEVEPLFDANPLKEVLMQKYIAFWGENGESVETYNDIRRIKAEGKGDEIYDNLINPGKFPLRAPYGNDDVVSNPNIAKLFTDAGNYVFTEPVWWAGGTR